MSVQSPSETADTRNGVPPEFLRGERAPQERTLIDILRSTTSQFPDAPAIDDGTVSVSYRELIEDIDEGAQWPGPASGAAIASAYGCRPVPSLCTSQFCRS